LTDDEVIRPNSPPRMFTRQKGPVPHGAFLFAY
jgi:hypothetical protein